MSPEKRHELIRENFRLLKGCKMAAFCWRIPVSDIGKSVFGPMARRADDFFWEHRDSSG